MIPKRKRGLGKTIIRNIGSAIIVMKIMPMEMRMIGLKDLMDLAVTTRNQDGYVENNCDLSFDLLFKH